MALVRQEGVMQLVNSGKSYAIALGEVSRCLPQYSDVISDELGVAAEASMCQFFGLRQLGERNLLSRDPHTLDSRRSNGLGPQQEPG
jgi:hypothetical protein